MKKDVYEFIISELRKYKFSKASLNVLDNDDNLGVSAQRLSQVPPSVTNKFSSTTENQAFNRDSYFELTNDTRRVENWLNSLHDEERFMLENFYIHNRTYNTIINNWKMYYSRHFWKKRRVSALDKIYVLVELESQKKRKSSS